MNKVLVDTNVWVDIALARPAFEVHSKGAVMACLEEQIELLVAATSLKDIFYFADQSAGHDAAYRAIQLVMDVATPAAVDEVTCRKALEHERPDFEDGIIAACALIEQADAIISRDDAAFNDLPIPRYTPEGFLAELGYEEIAL